MPPADPGQSSSADQPRKRPRRVISCLRCREKKLKCDRVSPCENCCKAGCLENCVFQHGPESEAKRLRSDPGPSNITAPIDQQPRAAGGTGIGSIEDLQRRLKRVEDLLAARPAALGVSRDGFASTASQGPRSDTRPDPGTLAVKGTRTRYHGQTSRIALLNELDGGKELLGASAEDSSVVRLVKEVQFLQSKSSVPTGSPESISELDASAELHQLRSCLPPIELCDRLVILYFRNFEHSLRIFHIPTFQTECFDFRLDSNRQSKQFIPQLTAVLALGLPFADAQFKQENPAICEYLQNSGVNLVRTWLQKLPRKPRIELPTLQTQALVILARWLRADPPEEIWRATGSLVRSAIVMGLHVDPSASTEIPPSQKEARRRLWATIVEMDLQASIVSGMPMAIPDVDFGPLTPRNVCDGEYYDQIAELPPARPLTERTSALMQVTLAASLPQRIKAISLAQTASSSTNQTEALDRCREMEDCLWKIPPDLKLDDELNANEGPSWLLNLVLLDLYIRRPLESLYRSILKNKIGDNQVHLDINNRLLDSSLAILSHVDYFDHTKCESDPETLVVYWEIFHVLCRTDILRAALHVCAYIRTAPAPWPPPHTKDTLVRTVEKAIDDLARTLHKPGGDVKDILLLTVALSSSRAHPSDEARKHVVKEGLMTALSTARQYLLPSTVQELPQTPALGSAQNVDLAGIMFPSTADLSYMNTTLPQLPDPFVADAALAAEFGSFMAGPFGFDDGDFGGLFSRW
ncbi:fungal-specific transcription factor domain-containing protein [Aspergillus aurantiobrunneus]